MYPRAVVKRLGSRACSPVRASADAVPQGFVPAARRRLAVGSVVLGCVAAFACGRHEPPPNVVLIVIDSLRADHVQQYGYSRQTAPDLEDFAAAATLFTNCHSSAPWTNPSIASLFTGLVPARHGANGFGATLPAEHVTLAEALAGAGYHTAAISFNPGIRSELQYDQGFEEFDEYLGKSAAYPDASEMLARLEAWLDRAPPQPFFMYLQVMNVHGPYRVPTEHQGDLLGRPPSREFKYYGDVMRRILRRGELELRDSIPGSYRQSLVDQYDTAIRYTTGVTASMLAALGTRGLLDPALVILTADHGEELLDHGGFSHGFSLHRELLHVPLYVKFPYQRSGAVDDRRVDLIDVYPTVLAAAGVASEVDLDGASLDPRSRGRRAGPEREVRLYQDGWHNRCVARALAADGYKIIEIDHNYEGLRDVVELYDERADPDETVDLAAERPVLAAALRARLGTMFAVARERQVGTSEDRAGELDQDRLRALGYVE